MRANRILFGAVLALLLATSARAATPLRLVPDQAELVLQIHEPRRLVDTFTTLELAKQLQQLEGIKELLDSTNYRRFYQLVAHFEKELDLDHKELLDKVAGGGAVVAAKYGDKAPALLVVQGTDPTAVEKFFQVGIALVEQELARQDVKAQLGKESYHGIEMFSLGNDFHAARAENAILISNRREALRAGLDRALGKEKKSLAGHAGLVEAAKLLPPKPLATIWLDIEPARKNPMFKAVYDTPRDPFITIVGGGWANVLGRTPYLAGGLYADSKEVLLTFRAPRGAEGMGGEGLIYRPADGGPGSRPLLQPKGLLFSTSAHYDISRFWTERVELFGAERAKEIEKFDKTSATALSSIGFSKLLTCMRGYQRTVAVHQPKAGYTIQPRNAVPAFGVVVELSKPEEFEKGMETILRSLALGASFQFGLKMVEEKIGDVELVGYRFDEKKKLANDPDGFRFNFSPCFVRVGNQYVVSSTMELGRELVGLLQQEAKKKPGGSGPSSRQVFASAGARELLKSFEDQIVTAGILGQALALDQAKEQAQLFLALFNRLDNFTKEETYAAREFYLDLRLKFKK